MITKLLLPTTPKSNFSNLATAQESSILQVNDWIHYRSVRARTIFEDLVTTRKLPFQHVTDSQVDKIINILTSRVFSHQSRGRVASLIPQYREKLLVPLSKGTRINLFLLYNGGYRASPLSTERLIFEPDPTELLLLYQIALLTKEVSEIYPPSIQFSIVINNGVAHWVNDIPLESTKSYANIFRDMIQWLGAADYIKIILQSELPDFITLPKFNPTPRTDNFTKIDHKIVERFLGRICCLDEARLRHALYTLAEARWAQDLLPLINSNNGLLLRQIAHPKMLSFRPFPGGATRIQNGSLGFQESTGKLIPKLITSTMKHPHEVRAVPWTNPWNSSNPTTH